MEFHKAILKSPDPMDVFYCAVGDVIGRLVPTLFCIVDLGTSNCLMPAAAELMMLCRLLTLPDVAHARNADH